MPTLAFDARYAKSYRAFTKKNRRRIQAIDRILRLFSKNPQHPSLQLEKLRGSTIWTIRIDKGSRLFFVWSDTGDTAIFFLVGPHDTYRKAGNLSSSQT